jgi:hypothetical protein
MPGHTTAKTLFDGTKRFLLAGGDKGAGIACCVCPAGPAYPVNVILGNWWHIEVADETEVLHIYPPGGDIRCHKDTKHPTFKSVHGFGSLSLGTVAVNTGTCHPVFFEEIGQPVGPMPGTGKGKYTL